HAAGFAYAVNTVGTIAGTLIAGFVAVPNLGVQGTHVAALAISLAVGLTALLLARSRGELAKRDGLWIGGALAVVAAVLLFGPRWNASIMSQGAFRPVQASSIAQQAQLAPGERSVLQRASELERVLFYREGINGSVLVGTDPAGANRWLRVSGKI